MGCGGSKASACEALEVVPAVGATDGTADDRKAHCIVSSTEESSCAEEVLAEGGIANSNESTAYSENSNDTATPRELTVDSHGDEGAAEVASAVIAEAASLLQQHQVLNAEEVLARALARLDEASSGDAAAAEAASVLRTSETYAAVYALCRRFDEVADMLGAPSGRQKLMWEDEGAQLWLHTPADETWLEFRLVCDIDAPLSHCLASGTEVDLIPEYEPNVVGTPACLGQPNAWVSLVRVVIGVLMLRLELIYEICRFYNTEQGFLAESIRSDFPEEGRSVPPRHWRYKRMKIRTSSLWIPQGGGKRGTTAVQSSRVDAGFKLPDFIVEFFFRKLAPSMIGNLRKNAMSVGKLDGPYAKRLAEDSQGVYAECARVEEAASHRQSCSAGTLPGQEWFRRPWRLAAPPAP